MVSYRCDRPLNLYPKFFHISHRENGSFEVFVFAQGDLNTAQLI